MVSDACCLVVHFEVFLPKSSLNPKPYLFRRCLLPTLPSQTAPDQHVLNCQKPYTQSLLSKTRMQQHVQTSTETTNTIIRSNDHRNSKPIKSILPVPKKQQLGSYTIFYPKHCKSIRCSRICLRTLEKEKKTKRPLSKAQN